MSFARPAYNAQQVNAAARIVVDVLRHIRDKDQGGTTNADDIHRAFDVMNNWRASHQFPLNTLHMTLRNRARSLSKNSITAQRIKRYPSILEKLLNSKDMKLSQMQDIAGCRAILPSLANVYEMRDVYLSDRRQRHEFTGERNYIAFPKETGYRGLHLKYRFVGKGPSEPFHGMKVEIQVRTALQHKWATAVEAVGTVVDQALKANKGNPDWLRFFSLMSTVFALREGAAIVPGTSEKMSDLREEIRQLEARNKICDTFRHLGKVIKTIEEERVRAQGVNMFLVRLDAAKGVIHVKGFTPMQSQPANLEYTQGEMDLFSDEQTQSVLVSVDSIAALKRAYPNYFLDTLDFGDEVNRVISGAS